MNFIIVFSLLPPTPCVIIITLFISLFVGKRLYVPPSNWGLCLKFNNTKSEDVAFIVFPSGTPIHRAES